MKKQTINSIQGKFKFWLYLSAVCAGLVACSSSETQSQQMGKYYSEHYPQQLSSLDDEATHRSHSQQSMKNLAFWGNGESGQPLNIARVNEARQANVLGKNQLSTVSKKNRLISGELSAYPDFQYGATDDISGQNTSSMIEGKIFKLVEDAYLKRDYSEFVKLYALFVESFPHSSQKGFLDEKREAFFYSENLKVESLKNALVEIKYPEARSMDELKTYFQKLKTYGIKVVQIDVVQTLGDPIFLFARQGSREGYYFSNSVGPIVDDLLDQIAEVAHSEGLKLYASLPLRNHPYLGDNTLFVMDETWNAFQNRTIPNSKLDLLNPNGKELLLNLVEELLESNVDGIVFRDDFTYEFNEGFSEVALDRFMTDTGRPLGFNNMFVPVRSPVSQKYEILTSDEFDDMALWRSREINQFLWDLVAFIRERKSDLVVGLELTSEMILDELNPQKWHSTGIGFLKDLNVDFYTLKWRKFKSEQESDPLNYDIAAQVLRAEIATNKEIYLKIPLSQTTKNVIEFNRKISSHAEFQRRMKSTKIAIGPVDRTEQLDVLN